MVTSRRSFLTGLSSIIAAPAIVRASSLMPVKQMVGKHFERLILDDPWEGSADLSEAGLEWFIKTIGRLPQIKPTHVIIPERNLHALGIM